VSRHPCGCTIPANDTRPRCTGTHMLSSDLQRYKRMLLEKQREVLTANSDIHSQLGAAGLTEGDLIDRANADAEAELQVRLRQTDGKLLRGIEEALVRIKRGTYGLCTSCQQPISVARLRAVPWAQRCLKCKEQDQRAWVGKPCNAPSKVPGRSAAAVFRLLPLFLRQARQGLPLVQRVRVLRVPRPAPYPESVGRLGEAGRDG
jgi:DnaK suppressor protein